MNDQVTTSDRTAVASAIPQMLEVSNQLFAKSNCFLTGNNLIAHQKNDCNDLQQKGVLPFIALDVRTDTTNKPSEKSQPTTDGSLKDPHSKLEDDIDSIKNYPGKERLHKAAAEFEERAKADHLPQAEIDEFYKQVDRLITTSPSKVSEGLKPILAEQLLEHAARPHDIDQGRYETCNVTVLEERGFTSHPSKMAEIVTAMALEGNWNGIQMDDRSLEPQHNAIECPPVAGIRTFASQILNVAIVNDITQGRKPPMYYSEEINLNDARDNGERLRYKNGIEVTFRDLKLSNSELPVRSPSVSIGDIQAEGTKLFGDSGYCIANIDKHFYPHVIHIHSAKDLEGALRSIQSATPSKMPAVLMVDGNNAIFHGGVAGRKPEAHVISILEYDEKHHRVLVSNQWGNDGEGWFSIEQLFGATRIEKEHPKH
jgi:hypothetical protein